jgi:formyltetrahydrofolate hydrolase
MAEAISENRYILRCVAPDRIGILAAVMGFIAERHLSIVESHDYADPDTGKFFIRAEILSGLRHLISRLSGWTFYVYLRVLQWSGALRPQAISRAL